MAKEIVLGMTYEDKITGFTGVCTGICSYLTGCSQALILPRGKGDDHKEGRWLDIQRLVLDEDKDIVVLDNEDNAGFGDVPSRTY